MKRRLFTILSALSLLLFVAVIALFVRWMLDNEDNVYVHLPMVTVRFEVDESRHQFVVGGLVGKSATLAAEVTRSLSLLRLRPTRHAGAVLRVWDGEREVGMNVLVILERFWICDFVQHGRAARATGKPLASRGATPVRRD